MIYAVILEHDPPVPMEDLVREHWVEYRIVASNVVLVQDDEKTLNEIAKAVGIGAEVGVPGMVVSLGGLYSGYHNVELWNWLERAMH